MKEASEQKKISFAELIHGGMNLLQFVRFSGLFCRIKGGLGNRLSWNKCFVLENVPDLPAHNRRSRLLPQIGNGQSNQTWKWSLGKRQWCYAPYVPWHAILQSCIVENHRHRRELQSTKVITIKKTYLKPIKLHYLNTFTCNFVDVPTAAVVVSEMSNFMDFVLTAMQLSMVNNERMKTPTVEEDAFDEII